MFNAIRNHLNNHALRKTRAELLNLTDAQLEDVGISRFLLEAGIDTWPWREADVPHLAAQPAKMNAKEVDSAIRELSRMSDKDLRDIGIDRGTIRQSVIQGVEGRGSREAA